MDADETLWRVNGWGRQLVGPNRPYWWENRERIPERQVVGGGIGVWVVDSGWWWFM